MQPEELQDDTDGLHERGRELEASPTSETRHIPLEAVSIMINIVERLRNNGGRIETRSDWVNIDELCSSNLCVSMPF